MPAGLIGLGNMGCAIANLMAGNGHAVLGWEFDASVVADIQHNHRNERFLPGVALHENLLATGDLKAVLADGDPLFIALPSRFIRPTLEPLRTHIPAGTLLVNIAKGLDADSGKTAFTQLNELFPNNPCLQLSGPSIANEFAREQPTAVVLAGANVEQRQQVSALLDNAFFATQHSDDPVGVELGGILKNIYALGLGLMEGSNIANINFKGAYLTQALQEMQQLGAALGAKPESFLGIAGIGDLIATALSEHSHNVRMGRLLAQGQSNQVALPPEGLNTLRVALRLAQQHALKLPLAAGLDAVIAGRETAVALCQGVLKGR